MKRLSASAAALALLVMPAVAQTVSPDQDKLLWCASAFYWLAGSAEDSGDAEEADMYDRWSKKLLDIAGPTLVSAGFQPDSIEALVARYDERALAELNSDNPPYDIVTCPTLLTQGVDVR